MFSNNLKFLRKGKGYSQQFLAKLLDVENYTISDWENGRSEPSIEELKKLCVIFNISADELLEIDTPEARKYITFLITSDEKDLK